MQGLSRHFATVLVLVGRIRKIPGYAGGCAFLAYSATSNPQCHTGLVAEAHNPTIRDAGGKTLGRSYRPSFPNPSSTTMSRSVGPLRRVDSAMAGAMSSGSVICCETTPIERASPVKSIGGSLNSIPV